MDSEGQDQTAHTRSLIRAFTVRKQNYWIVQNVWIECKGLDDTSRMCRMIWICTLCACSKTLFAWRGPIDNDIGSNRSNQQKQNLLGGNTRISGSTGGNGIFPLFHGICIHLNRKPLLVCLFVHFLFRHFETLKASSVCCCIMWTFFLPCLFPLSTVYNDGSGEGLAWFWINEI